MLLLRDRKLLGDGPNGENLRNEEAVARLHERNRKDLDKYRWDDQDDMINCEKRQGQMMCRSDLIRRVTRLNSRIHVEQSINFPDCLGFYDVNQLTGEKRYLSSFAKGWMPEFSYILLDWQDIPETEVRGWRTTIVRLLKAHALTWRQVYEEFGNPTNPINARRWYAQVEEFRS
jgi:hypothetical protein